MSNYPSTRCGKFVYWWDGEYEGECELPEGHEGDHYDGISWFNDDGENTDDAHPKFHMGHDRASCL